MLTTGRLAVALEMRAVDHKHPVPCTGHALVVAAGEVHTALHILMATDA
jgi:hypothetical protein